MFATLKTQFLKTPTPLVGLALGLGSLGVALDSRLAASGQLQIVFCVLAALFILLVATKFLLQPSCLSSDLTHPVVSSVLPTTAMALMVISKSVAPFHVGASTLLWYSAIGLHLFFLSAFIRGLFKHFSVTQMVPSWFVPPIGLVVAAVTCPGPEQQWLAQWICLFGLVCYAIMLPPMLYRLIFKEELNDASKPTIAVLAAPASLNLAGYLTVTEEPSLLLVCILLGVALLMSLLVYIAFFHLLRLPFSPAYSAFTFPIVIGATAVDKCFTFFQTIQLPDTAFLSIVADIELAMATLIVSYVLFRYLLAWAQSLRLNRAKRLVEGD